ncbi:bifunctional glycosyltransferase/class I SAM-dependent methyltransferase [Butyrivibrio sp. YAB3001]|uniref:bifunctional glycosyltransferase/class I SAM-dependent methyltransferase n=1 Tax=Butyrivibrio sp. YAB3001 TaxID=1520812 RepID=UPI0008F66FEA|nr:methyltransferase domain-containing protein [Butyrivibrio sp. YAB3001]SFB94658.1 Methyltransferase domain-containing protein [Butyrivibrio sp. YAB3001]
MEHILSAVQRESWNEALDLFIEYTKTHELDENLCIIGATILEYFNDRNSLFDLIQTGLRFNYHNYELYLLLGNFYRTDNSNKALLSYENALYYAKKHGPDEDVQAIEAIIDDFNEKEKPSVNKTSIVVIYYEGKDFLERCIDSIRTTCFEQCYDLLCIDVSDFEKRAEIINESIKSLNEQNDILLLSSDVMMMPNALFSLRMALYDKNDVGACSAVSNCAFFYQMPEERTIQNPKEAFEFSAVNNIPSEFPYESKCVIDGACLLIKNEVKDKVFPLDDSLLSDRGQYTDIGLKVISNGYKNYVCWNSFVYRFIRESMLKKNTPYQDRDKEKIQDKWGFYADYYLNMRREPIKMIREDNEAVLDILEVGAGLGSTLARIKYLYPHANIKGIELVENVAEMASNYMNMECGNIETYSFGEDEKYDYIVFADVLEHLVDPYSLVDRLKKNLKSDGCIIASIPNIMNAKVIYDLLRGNFEYQDSGVLDRTHLRFFTKKEVKKLFEERGYEIVEMSSLKSLTDNTDSYNAFFDKLLAIEEVADKEQFDTFQYVVCAKVI